MKETRPHFNSIDDYIAAFPKDVQAVLETLRRTIKAAAPRTHKKNGAI